MSYKITCYFTDSGISTTQIDILWGSSYTRGYNEAMLEVYADMPTTFTATPAYGATFVKWAYRIGDVTNPLHETSENPFRYEPTVTDSSQSIWIRAISNIDDGGGGGGGDSNWLVVNGGSYSNLSSTVTLNPSIQAGNMLVYSATFANSGSVSFVGGYGIYAYISSSANQSNGTPSSILASDTSGGMTFDLSYTVTAGSTYYFWVRYPTTANYGDGYIAISPPSGSVTTGSGFYIYTSSGWKKATPYIYSGGTWVKCKPCIYTSSGWIRGK